LLRASGGNQNDLGRTVGQLDPLGKFQLELPTYAHRYSAARIQILPGLTDSTVVRRCRNPPLG